MLSPTMCTRCYLSESFGSSIRILARDFRLILELASKYQKFIVHRVLGSIFGNFACPKTSGFSHSIYVYNDQCPFLLSNIEIFFPTIFQCSFASPYSIQKKKDRWIGRQINTLCLIKDGQNFKS